MQRLLFSFDVCPAAKWLASSFHIGQSRAWLWASAWSAFTHRDVPVASFQQPSTALLELWGSLLSGATLALAPDGPVQQPGGMLHVNLLALTIRQFGVSTLCLPVSSLHGLIYDSPQIFSRLNNLVIQNEQDSTLSPQRLQWLAGNHPRLRIVHTYGTIETSGYALSYTVPRAYQAQASVPVGQPIDGCRRASSIANCFRHVKARSANWP